MTSLGEKLFTALAARRTHDEIEALKQDTKELKVALDNLSSEFRSLMAFITKKERKAK
jgi:predicted  nucleic acid-binding Zn-ribbon protein